MTDYNEVQKEFFKGCQKELSGRGDTTNCRYLKKVQIDLKGYRILCSIFKSPGQTARLHRLFSGIDPGFGKPGHFLRTD
jgi:hypothetical protein